MPARIQSESWRGSGSHRRNEDFACWDATAGCAVLVDGATGLTGVQLVEHISDAAWYARELATRCVCELRDVSVTTGHALATAARAVAKDYLDLPGANSLRREDLPNGSLAVVRWDGSVLEVTMLGDCTAMLVLRDGDVRVVHDATLDAMDRDNYERMYAHAIRHQTTMAQARKDLNEYFVRNRLLMNEPGGYWAADVTCRGFGHETTTNVNIEELSAVCLCTDGFAAAVDMGVVSSLAELGTLLACGEGRRLARELRHAEEADASCRRVHRSKTSDDATYVVVSL